MNPLIAEIIQEAELRCEEPWPHRSLQDLCWRWHPTSGKRPAHMENGHLWLPSKNYGDFPEGNLFQLKVNHESSIFWSPEFTF